MKKWKVKINYINSMELLWYVLKSKSLWFAHIPDPEIRFSVELTTWLLPWFVRRPALKLTMEHKVLKYFFCLKLPSPVLLTYKERKGILYKDFLGQTINFILFLPSKGNGFSGYFLLWKLHFTISIIYITKIHQQQF